MRSAGWIFAVLIAVLNSACTAPDDSFGNPNDGYPDNAVQIADAADWDAVQTVQIELSEFSYAPETLKFRKGRPYALALSNTGSIAHRFMARGFFRAIAVRGIVYEDAEAGYPTIEAVSLEPQETKTLYFVPVIRGNYYLSCDRPLHATLGMVGRLAIE